MTAAPHGSRLFRRKPRENVAVFFFFSPSPATAPSPVVRATRSHLFTSLRHPARSPPQDKSRKRDFGEDEEASEYGNLRKKTSAASEHAPLAPVTNVALSAGK